MNNFEYIRGLQKINEATIRAYGVGSVQLHQSKIITDLGDANARGKTFAGNNIAGVGRFSDWYETGEFFDKLRFADTENIDLTSNGDGFEAIQGSYSESEYIAPTAKVLSENTLKQMKSDFIYSIKQTIQTEAK